jgi:hypothetical protein
MARYGAQKWLVIGVLLLGSGIAVSCGDGKPIVEPDSASEAVVRPRQEDDSVKLSYTRSGGWGLLTTACTNKSGSPAPQNASANCIEVWGDGPAVYMDVPTQGPPDHEWFGCDGWGPVPGGSTRYLIPYSHTFFASALLPADWDDYAFVAGQQSDHSFEIIPIHPTLPASPIRVQCTIDIFSFTIDIPILPLTPIQLVSMSMNSPQTWLRPPATVIYTASYTDNYNGVNLMPIPTTNWTSSNAQIATVTGGGAGTRTATVSGVAMGTATITATSGTKSAARVITVEGCSALPLTPAGPLTINKGAFVNVTANPACDIHIVAGNEPVAWTSLNPAIATVQGTQTGNHVGKITGVNAGTATIKACATTAPNPPTLCTNITVNVQAFVTQVTSTLDGTTWTKMSGTNGHTISFVVKNIGNLAGTATLTCSATGFAACVSVVPSSVSLIPGQVQGVTVTYNALSGTAVSSIKLTATGGGSDQLFFTVEGAPFAAQIPYGPSSVRPNVNCEWMAGATGGYLPYSNWVWTVNGVTVPGVDNDIYYVNTGSSFTLGISVTDGHGQVASTTKQITVTAGAPYCNL